MAILIHRRASRGTLFHWLQVCLLISIVSLQAVQIMLSWRLPSHPGPGILGDNEVRNPAMSPMSTTTSSANRDWKLHRDRLVEIFRQVGENSSKTLPRAFPCRSQTTNHHDKITATIILGPSGFERLLYSARRWGGPVSAAIYITSEDQIAELTQFHRDNANDLHLTALHVLFERGDEVSRGFPHNILRQMAVDLVDTEFFLTLDVDLITPPNASHGLNALLGSDPNMAADLRKNTIMVLPAFERTANATDSDIVHNADQVLPQDKDELRKLVDRNEIRMFHDSFQPAQRVTDYAWWFEESPRSSTPYYFIDYEMRYEPYVIACKNARNLPKYWEGFRGYGYNKESWFTDLYFSGFQFAVLKDWFVIHLEHNNLGLQQSHDMDRHTLFRHYLKDKFAWDEETYQVVFQLNHRFARRKSYPGPPGIPKLVGWKEYKGKRHADVSFASVRSRLTPRVRLYLPPVRICFWKNLRRGENAIVPGSADTFWHVLDRGRYNKTKRSCEIQVWAFVLPKRRRASHGPWHQATSVTRCSYVSTA
jgi:hypothetical protein